MQARCTLPHPGLPAAEGLTRQTCLRTDLEQILEQFTRGRRIEGLSGTF